VQQHKGRTVSAPELVHAELGDAELGDADLGDADLGDADLGDAGWVSHGQKYRRLRLG